MQARMSPGLSHVCHDFAHGDHHLNTRLTSTHLSPALPGALPMPADNVPSPVVLSFAASDPTGGAGMQADLLTLAALGCHPLSVITAITVQDTAGVENILALDDDWIIDQARALLEDIPVSAFKLGMLGSLDNIIAIASIVADYPDIPLVLDPVLSSGRGDAFVNDDMRDAMMQLLLPQTTILTPNSLEARRLAADDTDEEDSHEAAGKPLLSGTPEELTLSECARRLLATGCEQVLITGTHESTLQVNNLLFGAQGLIRTDRWQRLPGSYHGSGCTLASAIAANLAHGLNRIDAVVSAQKYTWHTLSHGYRPGMGQYLPDRFFWARDDDENESLTQNLFEPSTPEPADTSGAADAG